MFTHPKVSRRQGIHSRRAAHDDSARRRQGGLSGLSPGHMRKCPRLLQVVTPCRMIEALVEEYQFSGEVSGFGAQESALCHVLREVVQRPSSTTNICEQCGLYGDMEITGSICVCRVPRNCCCNIVHMLSMSTRKALEREREIGIGDGRRSASILALQPHLLHPVHESNFAISQGHIGPTIRRRG